MSDSRGFTLIELMVVTAVIAILASIAVPYYQSSVNVARTSKAEQEIKTICRDIGIYQLQNNLVPPETLADVGHGGRRDPWGNLYQYLNFSTGTGSGASADGEGSSGSGSSGGGNGKSGGGNGKSSGGSSGSAEPSGVSIGQKRKDKNLVPVNTDFDLYSMGPDGRSAAPFTAKHSRDDIVRANNGEFIGLAAEY